MTRISIIVALLLSPVGGASRPTATRLQRPEIQSAVKQARRPAPRRRSNRERRELLERADPSKRGGDVSKVLRVTPARRTAGTKANGKPGPAFALSDVLGSTFAPSTWGTAWNLMTLDPKLGAFMFLDAEVTTGKVYVIDCAVETGGDVEYSTDGKSWNVVDESHIDGGHLAFAFSPTTAGAVQWRVRSKNKLLLHYCELSSLSAPAA